MSTPWVLVDGYSVMHAWPQLRKIAGRSLERRREALVTVLQQYADQSGRRVTVVFDGYAAKHKPELAQAGRSIEIVFSDSGKTADDTIERLVGGAGNQTDILVVTSDNVERQVVEGFGAQSMSADMFEVEVGDALRDLARSVHQHSRPRRLGNMGDEFDG